MPKATSLIPTNNTAVGRIGVTNIEGILWQSGNDLLVYVEFRLASVWLIGQIVTIQRYLIEYPRRKRPRLKRAIFIAPQRLSKESNVRGYVLSTMFLVRICKGIIEWSTSIFSLGFSPEVYHTVLRTWHSIDSWFSCLFSLHHSCIFFLNIVGRIFILSSKGKICRKKLWQTCFEVSPD